jgi:hypothetical protein
MPFAAESGATREKAAWPYLLESKTAMQRRLLARAAFLKGFTAAEPIRALAEAVAQYRDARVAFVGNRDHAASALYAGLITKEAVKVPAEGYIGGQFRHGPLELAGEGLTAILFGVFGDDDSPSLCQLAADLVATGAVVALVGDVTVPGTHTIPVPAEGGTLTGLVRPVTSQCPDLRRGATAGCRPAGSNWRPDALDVLTADRTEECAAEARDGDGAAREVLSVCGRRVGAGVGALLTLFRPARVVLDGSASRYLELFAGGFEEALGAERRVRMDPALCGGRARISVWGRRRGRYSHAAGKPQGVMAVLPSVPSPWRGR